MPTCEELLWQCHQKPTCGICRDCKWWDNTDDDVEAWGVCGNFDKVSLEQGGDMWTAPDFGCIQWEAKE